MTLPQGADKLTVKICEAEVFSGLLLLLWRYYAQKPIVFALSPLRLEQACASLPPHAAAGCVSPLAGNSLEGGYISRLSRFLTSPFGFQYAIRYNYIKLPLLVKFEFWRVGCHSHSPPPGGGWKISRRAYSRGENANPFGFCAFCILISCVGILLEQTACIRALPPALGTSLRQLSPHTQPTAACGGENIPQGIFKGGERESVRFLRVIFLYLS